MSNIFLNQRGNVLFYILIAVALFAALSFAVGNMMRGGDTDIVSEQQAGLVANEVLEYARDLKQTVQSLRISSGCEDDEISFERSPFDGSDTTYAFNNGRGDFACHVFHPNGGGMAFRSPPEGVGNGEYEFRVIRISSLGSFDDSGGADLHLLLSDIDMPLCQAINRQLSINANGNYGPLGRSNSYAQKGGYYKGDFDNTSSYGNVSGSLKGVMATCLTFEHAMDTRYFYYVLLAR